MNSQNPYGGYSAPSPRGAGRGGASLPNRPPVPLSHGPSNGPGGAMGGGYGARPPPPPMIPAGRGAPPPPTYGQGYGGGSNENYGAGPMAGGIGRGPPPSMMGGGAGRPPPPPPPSTSYGTGMRYDSGPPDGGYGGPASRFEPNAGPPMRPFSMGGPPNQYGPPYGDSRSGGGGGNGWNDDAGQQPRKRSRTDHSGGGGGDGGGRGPGGEKEYSDFLKERLKRERPGRTLFVRNIDFQANVSELRSQFESFGEVKSWFDLIAKRGLAFVSYYDIRSAETAKDALQSYRINGRELDVHYSLPRESELSRRCDRDKDQGTLLAFLRGGPPDLNDDEVHGIFSQFGEIRGIRLDENYTGRYVDFWDCRATKRAYDSLVNTPYRGGTWDLSFEWDLGMEDRMPDMQKHERDRERLRTIGYQPGEAGPRPGAEGSQERFGNDSGPNYGRGSSQESGYGSYGGNGGSYGQYGQQPSSGYSGPPPSYDGGGGGGGGGGGVKRGYDHDTSSSREPPMRRWGQPANNNADNGPPSRKGYGPSPIQANAPGSRPIAALPHHSSTFSPPTASAAPGAGGDRLEQAQKVQQLLASLKSGGGATNAGSPANGSRTAVAASSSGSGGGDNAASSSSVNPSLPSNIAALLQLAQNKSNGGQK